MYEKFYFFVLIEFYMIKFVSRLKQKTTNKYDLCNFFIISLFIYKKIYSWLILFRLSHEFKTVGRL